MDGYIKLHRKILENPVVCKDADHFAVWGYLLLNATHKEIPVLFQGKKITLLPGQLITGRRVIAERFSITESKVKRILIELEIDQQIVRQRSNQNSLITVLNWNLYQSIEQQNDQPVTSERPASDQPVTTNKNVKNVKNNINNIRPEYQKKYLSGSFELKCVDYLISSVKEEMPDAKLPNTDKDIDKWCDSIDKMVRLDKHSQDDVYNTLIFARADIFWKVNIRSASKFREKYEILFLQMKNKSNKPQPKQNSFNQFPQRSYSAKDMTDLEKKLINKNL